MKTPCELEFVWQGGQLLLLRAWLYELVPWLLQWHDERDAAFGSRRLGSFLRHFLNAELRRWGFCEVDLLAWRRGGNHR